MGVFVLPIQILRETCKNQSKPVNLALPYWLESHIFTELVALSEGYSGQAIRLTFWVCRCCSLIV
jgi:hypothetical protein